MVSGAEGELAAPGWRGGQGGTARADDVLLGARRHGGAGEDSLEGQ